MIGMLYFNGTATDTLFSDADSLIYSLDGKQLLIIQMCSQVFSLIIPAWIYSRLDRETIFNKDIFKTDEFFIACIFFATCIPLVAFSAYINEHIPLMDWMKDTEGQMADLLKKMLSFNSIWDLIIAIIVIGIIPAIGEEWVFRGIIQNQLNGILRNKWTAWIIASIVFSAIHLQFQGFIPRLLLGLALGFIYMRTGNLWHSILLHFFNNGIQVLGAYFYRDEILKQINNQVEAPPWYAILFSVLAASVSGYILINRTKNKISV
jgi:membrane protease YdiL (CAAX protease family)